MLSWRSPWPSTSAPRGDRGSEDGARRQAGGTQARAEARTDCSGVVVVDPRGLEHRTCGLRVRSGGAGRGAEWPLTFAFASQRNPSFRDVSRYMTGLRRGQSGALGASSGRALLANQKPVCDGSVAGPSERMEMGHIPPVSRLLVVGPPYGSVPPGRTGRKGRHSAAGVCAGRSHVPTWRQSSIRFPTAEAEGTALEPQGLRSARVGGCSRLGSGRVTARTGDPREPGWQ